VGTEEASDQNLHNLPPKLGDRNGAAPNRCDEGNLILWL
jgi:hypothetical protein